MGEDPRDHRRLLDRGYDPALPAALRAMSEVELEHALEQARPAHARRRAVRVFACGVSGFLRWARHDRGTTAAQSLHELQPRHHDVRRAVVPGALQLQNDFIRGNALEPFVGDRGARDVPAQAFEFLALMRAASPPGMQAEALPLGAQAAVAFPSRPGTVLRLSTSCPARGPSTMR